MLEILKQYLYLNRPVTLGALIAIVVVLAVPAREFVLSDIQDDIARKSVQFASTLDEVNRNTQEAVRWLNRQRAEQRYDNARRSRRLHPNDLHVAEELQDAKEQVDRLNEEERKRRERGE